MKTMLFVIILLLGFSSTALAEETPSCPDGQKAIVIKMQNGDKMILCAHGAPIIIPQSTAAPE